MKRISGVLCSIFALSIFVSTACAALVVPPAPKLDAPILDNANVLSSEQETELAELINADRLKTGHQTAVLIIPSLEGEVLEQYSIKVARQWGIGEKDKDNGVLLLIAINDRKLRIEVGSGLEGSLTDARSSRIIRNVITPEFKQNDYYNGIRKGIVEIQSATRGEAESASLGSGNSVVENLGGLVEVIVYCGVFVLFLVSWIVSILARTKTWWAGGVFGGIIALVLIFIFGFIVFSILAGIGLVVMGLLFDYVVSKNYKQRKSSGLKPSWWAGGTTLGGGGGSGGGSFGGGGFSGGGSSGSW